ncbi:hypothetical protein HYR99_07425 [Candidatus Poribacteria bacterium]|nr:hypothetical protein [Candidatus Poribacteria bacterium]
MGKGGINPVKPLTTECDCSGFVAWAIGIPRELPPRSGRWLQTTTYWQGGGEVGSGLFDPTTPEQAEPGDLYVYPDVGGRQGHIGIISEVQDGKPSKVIHCSKGNDTNDGDAIRKTDTAVFNRHPKTHIMKIDYEALRDLFDIPELDLDEGQDELPPSNARLHHPLLAYDTTLQLVITGRLVLEGNNVGGGVLYSTIACLYIKWIDLNQPLQR